MLLQIIFLNFKAKAAKGVSVAVYFINTTVIARNMKIKSTIFLLFSALFLCGCTEKIVMESEERERIAVAECVIDSEKKVQTVNLYYSAYVSEAECPKVEEAEVRITFALDTTYTIDLVGDKNDVFVDIDTSGCYEFVKVADGVWQAKFEPIEFARYNLEVTIPGEDSITTLTATMKCPPRAYIYHPYSWFINNPHATAASYQIVTGKDCKMWVYGLDYNPETLEYSVAEYIYTNHINADNFNITGVTKENIKEFKRPENFDWYDDYLKSDINVSSFARPCFLFEWSFDYDEEIVLPLDDGRFYAFHDIWPNELGYDFHDRYLRFNHNGNLGDMNGLWWLSTDGRESQFFTVAVNFKPYKYYYSHPRSHLVFETVSDDLDKYYSDVLMNDMATDLTLVWGRYHVHSNIKNGKGIFGAVYRSRSPWCYPGNYFYLD